MPRVRSQLAIQAAPELLGRVRAAAAARGMTVTRLLLAWIEAGLAGDLPAPGGAGLAERVAELEAAVALLQTRPTRSSRTGETPSPERVRPAPRTGDLAAPSGALTTAELAERLGMKRGSINERVRRAGGARVGLVMDGWRCVGQAPAPGGGPLRWLWEPA